MKAALPGGRSPAAPEDTKFVRQDQLPDKSALPPPDLSWIDDFWKQAGPYIFSREEDGILILPPNRVYRINQSGAAFIRFMKEGGTISTLVRRAGKGESSRRLRELEGFFQTLAGLYSGGNTPGEALERVAYSFDFSRLPILGEIALTYRCNNACLFCYAGCGSVSGGREGKGELSAEEWKRIIRLFKDEARIPFFSFSGGEPLIRRDLEDLVSYAAGLGLEVNLVSNGTLADDKRAASLYAAGLRTAQISLEAPEAGLHDLLSGRSGAFDESIRGIAALLEAGISVQTNTTINRRNLDAAAAMPAFLKSLGISRFAMNMYIPSSPPAREDLLVTYDEIGPAVDRVRKAAFAAGLTFYWYSPTPFCYYNPIARGMGNKSCAAADGLLSVAANGDILPCSSWNEALGNLLERPFADIWFSERALFFKRKRFAPAACGKCSAFTACQGACPLYWQSCGEGLLAGKGGPSTPKGALP